MGSISTLKIAEKTGKDHSRILAVVTWYLKTFGNEGITEYYYKQENNKKYKAYIVDKDVVKCLIQNGVIPEFNLEEV